MHVGTSRQFGAGGAYPRRGQGFRSSHPSPSDDAQSRHDHARAIDALRAMSDGGFRHLPVIEDGRIWGIVSRGDFTAMEIDRLEEETHLWECIR